MVKSVIQQINIIQFLNLEAKYKLFPSKLKEQVDTKQTSFLKVLAKHTKNFCLEITESGLRLKQTLSYYKQVQGVWQ